MPNSTDGARALGSPSGSADDNGPALDASVALPQRLAVDGAGNLYILQINGDIRRVDARRPHVITTVSSIGACTDNVDLEFDTVSGSLWAIYNSGPPDVRSALFEVPNAA